MDGSGVEGAAVLPTGPADGAAQDPVRALALALDDADELPVAERLELLRRAEALLAGELEALDGL
jgi:hypothetical protein